MSWDLDVMSVLPIDKQDDVSENFSPQYLAEVLSDYVVELQQEIKELKRTSIKIQPNNQVSQEQINEMFKTGINSKGQDVSDRLIKGNQQ